MILGFNLTSINAHADEKALSGNVEVNNTPSIDDVQERKYDFIGENKSVGILFSFKTAYGKAGDINIKGEIIYKVDDAKKVLKKWKDDKSLDEEISLTVLNFILNKCMAKSIEIADSLRLPPPIQFPYVVKSEQKKK